MRQLTVLLAFGLGLLAVASPRNAMATQQADLSGSWILNYEESDDPRAQMREMRGARGGDRPSFGGRRGGSGGGRGGGGFGGGDRERMRQTMRMAMQAAERFTVAQGDSTVTITYEERASLTLFTNGKKWKEEGPEGVEIEFTAQWKGEELQVERKIDGGGKVQQTFLLSDDGDQLFVITKVELGRRAPLKFRRVYDRADSSN